MLLTSLKSYDRSQFVKDVTAGIIVAIIALPLSIALALASGVGPEAGIFTAIVAGFVISALGGSSVQIAGPTAAFATIVAGIVAKDGLDGLVISTILAGIFLIATHGSLNSLAISRPALIWGLTSAVCFTIYCLYPQKLYNEYGLVNIIGWSSLIASIFLALVTKTFSLPHMDGRIIAASLAVAIVGSLIPFTIYGLGISILGSVKASLFVTVEPVSSALLTWIFLGTQFTRMDLIGFLLILGSIQVVAIMTFHNEKHIVKAEQTHLS